MPETEVTSAALAARLGLDESWIVERTGIRSRRVAGPGETTSDLALAAARRALESCAVAPETLDLIVVATVTGDLPTPATACLLQRALGAKQAFAFDLSAACAGALFALSVVDQYVRTGAVKRALVVGADLLTRHLDWTDPSTCILFGDGAGALVLEASDDRGPGVLSTHLGSDGALAEILWIPGRGSRRPSAPGAKACPDDVIRMNGREVFRHAVRTMVAEAQRALEGQGLSPGDVDHLFIHQANVRIIEATLSRLGIPRERCTVTADRFGNTSAASIPLCLDEAVRAGRLRAGQVLLLLAVGAGMTWGSAVVRW